MERNYFQDVIILAVCLSLLVGSFLLGKRGAVSCNSIENVEHNYANKDSNVDKDLGLVGEATDMSSMSSQSFACNARRAFDELTRLHSVRSDLEARQSRGEANRARTATIVRKTGQAKAAEASFRNCVKDMMPELFVRWESDLKSNKLNFRKWDEYSEELVGGISFEDLQKTAEDLDRVQR